MLLDANLLVFAVHRASPFHTPAREWLTARLREGRRIGLPWQTLGAFVRIVTQARVFDAPLSPEQAWARVTDWRGAAGVWTPEPGPAYADILGDLIRRHHVRGNLVTDAQLAALAIEHGLTLCSADTDFARFREVRWENPVAA